MEPKGKGLKVSGSSALLVWDVAMMADVFNARGAFRIEVSEPKKPSNEVPTSDRLAVYT